MRRAPSPNHGGAGVLTAIAIVTVAVLVLAPNVLAEGLGRLVAHVWLTAIAAITGLLGGLFGGR